MPEQDHPIRSKDELSSFSDVVRAKAGRDLINPEAATAFANSLAKKRLSLMEGGRARAIEGWVRTTLRRHWMRAGPTLPVDAARAAGHGAPWAVAAFEKGSLSELRLGQDQEEESMEVVDFLVGGPAPRLGRLSYPQALAQSKRWHAALAKAKSVEEDPEGIELFVQLANGRRWVEVKSAQSLSREGALMKHCVGSYASQVAEGQCRIFSLRSASNQPSLTVEARGQDEAGDPALAVNARQHEIEQIRGPFNAVPSMEQADDMRALFAGFLEAGQPVKGAKGLLSSGAVLDADTGELRLFEELPVGYPVDGDVSFHGRAPAGLDRPAFSGCVNVRDVAFDAPLAIHAKNFTADGCRGSHFSVANRSKDGSVQVLGVGFFGSIDVEADSVEILGSSSASGWGAPSAGRGAAGSLELMGIREPLSRMRVKAASAAVREVATLSFEFEPMASADGSLGKAGLERCRVEDLVDPLGMCAILECSRGGLPWEHAGAGREDAPGPSMARAGKERLLQAAYGVQDFAIGLNSVGSGKMPWGSRRQSKNPKERACAVVGRALATPLILMWGSLSAPSKVEAAGALAIGQGGVFGLSELTLEAVFDRASKDSFEMLMSTDPKSLWVQSLGGRFDPSLASLAGSETDWSARRFALSQWRARFERECHGMLGAGMDWVQWLAAFKADPNAMELGAVLGSARFEMAAGDEVGFRKASAAPSPEPPEGEVWDFGSQALDASLDSFGPWRFSAALAGLIAPRLEGSRGAVDRSWASAGSALADAVDRVGQVRGFPQEFAHDVSAEHVESMAALAKVALLWPGQDLTLCAKPAPSAEMRTALGFCPPTELAIGAAALAVGLAGLGAGEASGMAASIASMLGGELGISRGDLSAQSEWAKRLAASHVDAAPGCGLPGAEDGVAGAAASAVSMELARWLDNGGAVAAQVHRMQSERPLTGVDLAELADAFEALGGAELASGVRAVASPACADAPAPDPPAMSAKLALRRLAGFAEGVVPYGVKADFVESLDGLVAAGMGPDGFSRFDGGMPVDELPWLEAALQGSSAATMLAGLSRVRSRAAEGCSALWLLSLAHRSDALAELVSPEDYPEARKMAEGPQAIGPEIALFYLQCVGPWLVENQAALMAAARAGSLVRDMPEEARRSLSVDLNIPSKKAMAVSISKASWFTMQHRDELIEALHGKNYLHMAVKFGH